MNFFDNWSIGICQKSLDSDTWDYSSLSHESSEPLWPYNQEKNNLFQATFKGA
jgi:hypothetical protein